MTVIYTQGKIVAVLNKNEDGDFCYQQQDQTSWENVLLTIKELSHKSVNQYPTSFGDLSTLTAMMARQVDNLTWQLRILNSTGLSLSDDQNICGIDEELVFLYNKLDELQQNLQTVIEQQTKRRTDTLNGTIKLNLGAGELPLQGWINIDATASELPYNVLWGLPFADNSVDFVYSAYLLEHIRYKDEALNFLKEIKRVLKPGGVVRLCVPHIKPFMAAYLNSDHDFFNHVESQWGFSFGDTNLERVLNYAGVNHKLGVIDDHKFGYDAEILEKLLTETQFSKFYASSFMESLYKELMIDTNKLAAETYQGESLSLIYEVIK